MVYTQWVKIHKGEVVVRPGNRAWRKSHWVKLKVGDVVVPRKILQRNIDVVKMKRLAMKGGRVRVQKR